MQQSRDRILRDVVTRNGWEAKPEELHGSREEKSTFKISLTKDEILSALRRPEGIRWIGILPEEKDQIAGAMLDTNVDPQALSRPTHTGDGTGIFMTENGCPNPGSIVNYTRLGGTWNTLHSQIVGGIVRAVSPDSHLFCRNANIAIGGPVLPAAADLDGAANRPPIHIISRSNGAANNRLYDALTRDWDNFSYTNNVVIFQNSGNNAGTFGSENNIVASPGHGHNLVTVGSYDDFNDTNSAFSSFLDSTDTLAQKPEITAPGNAIVVPGVGGGSGTSLSTPHAAGFAANLMENATAYRYNPQLVKASMLAGARRDIAGPADAIGVGGIDYLQHVNGDWVHWWRGANAVFDQYDLSSDGFANSVIESRPFISAGVTNIRFALSWQLRGTYTFNNLAQQQSIGADYDLWILDPNGNVVASDWDNRNPYAFVSFNPTVSGVYKVRMWRRSNSDSTAKFALGLAMNWSWQ